MPTSFHFHFLRALPQLTALDSVTVAEGALLRDFLCRVGTLPGPEAP